MRCVYMLSQCVQERQHQWLAEWEPRECCAPGLFVCVVCVRTDGFGVVVDCDQLHCVLW